MHEGRLRQTEKGRIHNSNRLRIALGTPNEREGKDKRGWDDWRQKNDRENGQKGGKEQGKEMGDGGEATVGGGAG